MLQLHALQWLSSLAWSESQLKNILEMRSASDIGRKEHFFEKKGHQIFHQPLFNPLSVLHQNKAMDNFYKRGKHPIVGHIKGLD